MTTVREYYDTYIKSLKIGDNLREKIQKCINAFCSILILSKKIAHILKKL